MTSPNYNDIINDDNVHIGHVYPNDNMTQYDDERWDQLTSISHPSSLADGTSNSNTRRRNGKLNYDEDDDDGRIQLCDPTVAHVRMGMVYLPVEMTLPTTTTTTATTTGGSDDRLCEKKLERNTINGEGNGDGNNATKLSESPKLEKATAPSFSMKQSSRVVLYASSPPPPTVLQPNDTTTINTNANTPMYDESDLSQAKKRLARHSGFYTGIGTTSAMSHSEGYCDTILSFNYRHARFFSLPLLQMRQRQLWVRDDHCNLQLGCHSKPHVGSTLSSLDGKTRLRWDVGNPFHHLIIGSLHPNQTKKSGIVIRSSQSDYAMSACRDFVCSENVWRVYGRIKLMPTPPPVFLPTSNNNGNNNKSAIGNSTLHLQHFDLTFTNLNEEHGRKVFHSGKRSNILPKVSLSLGYGMPLTGSERLQWMSQSLPNAGSHGIGICDSSCAIHDDERINAPSNSSSSLSSYPANLKLDVTHDLSPSRSCRTTLEYHHGNNQSLSLGTLITRTFRSSNFSRLGVGIRYAFTNIFHNNKQGLLQKLGGNTWWLFQLERGDVRFVVPISISPRAVTAWDSLVRVCHASLASFVLDVLVGELLCGVTSKLRLSFLRIVLGEETMRNSNLTFEVDKEDSDDERKMRKERDEERWLHHRFNEARMESSRQVNLMMRQANIATKKEKERGGGLIIVKAVYGVMDDANREWVRHRRCQDAENSGTTDDADEDSPRQHVMDATTQLRFWVVDSSLHLPAVSKKHMLGFYDALEFVSEEEWSMMDDAQFGTMDERECDDNNIGGGGDRTTVTRTLDKWWKTLRWMAPPGVVEKKHDLVVVLSIRYEWDGRMYDVMFRDEEAVDLPSRFAREV